MRIGNTPDNIFTEYDESIFTDGSIDPMGLRIIWTSIGSKIFHNKLNTISTDIKLYTLNLFHHYLIQKVAREKEDLVNRIIRKKPYYNKSDLFDGLAIFLENLLINVVYNKRSDAFAVPGINKFSNLKRSETKKRELEKIAVNRNKGILVRQYLLGIHGRHRGPFTQMGIFPESTEDIYSNISVWENAAQIFSQSPWKEAGVVLSNLIDEMLNKPPRSGAFIEVKVSEVLTENLAEKYVALLKRENYVVEGIKNFWLNRLGLKNETAGILYETYLREKESAYDYQEILVKAYENSNDPFLGAINAIEPFLTLVDKCVNRILSRGTISIDDDLRNFTNDWLYHNSVDENRIKTYLTKSQYMSEEAENRLTKLLEVYTRALTETDPAASFIIGLISYHDEIMKVRGNLNWVSIGNDNRISVHKSFPLSEEYLQSKNWVNTYYLPTVASLHNGLVYETA